MLVNVSGNTRSCQKAALLHGSVAVVVVVATTVPVVITSTVAAAPRCQPSGSALRRTCSHVALGGAHHAATCIRMIRVRRKREGCALGWRKSGGWRLCCLGIGAPATPDQVWTCFDSTGFGHSPPTVYGALPQPHRQRVAPFGANGQRSCFVQFPDALRASSRALHCPHSRRQPQRKTPACAHPLPASCAQPLPAETSSPSSLPARAYARSSKLHGALLLLADRKMAKWPNRLPSIRQSHPARSLRLRRHQCCAAVRAPSR